MVICNTIDNSRKEWSEQIEESIRWSSIWPTKQKSEHMINTCQEMMEDSLGIRRSPDGHGWEEINIHPIRSQVPWVPGQRCKWSYSQRLQGMWGMFVMSSLDSPKSGLRNPFYLHDSIWLRAETRMPQNQNSMGCHDFLRFMGYPHYTNPYQRNPYLMMPKPPWLMENMWISTNASPGDCNSGWFTESASHRQAKASNGLGGRENLKQNKGWPENHACRTM